MTVYPDSNYHTTSKSIVTLELHRPHMVVKVPYGLICRIGAQLETKSMTKISGVVQGKAKDQLPLILLLKETKLTEMLDHC